MGTLNQRSFTGGELAPSLHARVDTAKYQNGARTMRNFMVMRHGGVQNRPGSEYLAEVKDSADSGHRLIPFVYSDEQAYVLEFGDYYARIYQDGVQLDHGTVAAWANTTAYTAGTIVSYSGTDYYCTNAHTSATADNRPSTGTDWQTYWYAQPTGILELPSPYAIEDLAKVKFVQSADVMTLVHEDYPAQELARLSANVWTLTPRSSLSVVSSPTGVTNNGAAVQAQKQLASISFANPAVLTVTSHGFSSGDLVRVYIKWQYNTGAYNIVYNYVNDFVGTVTVLSVDTFSIIPVGQAAAFDTSASFTGWTVASSGIVKQGTSAAALFKTQFVVTAVNNDGIESQPSLPTGTSDTPATGTVITVTWTAVSGVSKYNVYKKTGALFGFIGTADRPLFQDNGITPDTTLTAPFADQTLFAAASDYPSSVGYYQQRLLFGRSLNKPETVWASRTGDFPNFSKRQPLQDDDSIEFNLAGRQVAQVKHLMDLGKLLVFASTGEFFCNGDAAGILTPTDVNVRQHSNFGANDLAPIQIGNNALFVQARGSLVRDLGFDWQTEGYKGNDLTIFSAHLFDGYTISDWCYQQIPHSIVWAVRSDGVLLGLTYLPEHQIWGWHRHDTDGTVEAITSIPEGNEDAVYILVNRDGGRYVERFASRQVSSTDTSEWKFLDSFACYDGRNVAATTMTLSGSGWTYTDPLTLTASAGTFVAGDVGNQFWLTGSDGTVIRCTVTAYTSATAVTVLPHKTVPASMQAVAITTWTKAVDSISGLDHLEGKEVAVFADGFVVATPNNPAYTSVTVTSGAITLDKPYGVVCVGLPYLCDLETLDIDTVQGETLVDKRKLITEVWVYTEKSRGIWAGGSEPETGTTTGLYELKKRSSEGYDSPVSLSTGTEQILIRPEWNSHGRVFLRQTDPLPLAILAVAPKGNLPMRA